MDNILVIGSGNHHNTLGVIRAIGLSGFGVDLVTIDGMGKNYVAQSKYVTNHYEINGIENLSIYLSIMLKSHKCKTNYNFMCRLGYRAFKST